MGEEPDGLTQHPWLLRPNDDRPWLYKPVEIKAGNRQLEDWAEKAVSEVAAVLGVPRARVELAHRAGSDGSVSRDIKPRGWDMEPGAALLDGRFHEYESRTRYRTGHSLDNIHVVLSSLGPPPDDASVSGLTGFEVFCGYLVLDALVANRDRHDHNWAIVIPPSEDDQPALAASYDHASSLGFNLRDDRRQRILQEQLLTNWAARGTAWRFEHSPPPARPDTLVDLAVAALTRASTEARNHWIASLRAVTARQLLAILDRMSYISTLASAFAIELMLVNRERLLRPLAALEGRA